MSRKEEITKCIQVVSVEIDQKLFSIEFVMRELYYLGSYNANKQECKHKFT
jgi:hypothetical protein